MNNNNNNNNKSQVTYTAYILTATHRKDKTEKHIGTFLAIDQAQCAMFQYEKDKKWTCQIKEVQLSEKQFRSIFGLIELE